MNDWELTLITPETILRDALDVIDRTGSRIIFVVDVYRYLFDKLNASRNSPLSYSSGARFLAPPRVASCLVKLRSSLCSNLPIVKNNHCTNKL